jgi:hypothetical protein
MPCTIISRPVHTLTVPAGSLPTGAAGSFCQVPCTVAAGAAGAVPAAAFGAVLAVSAAAAAKTAGTAPRSLIIVIISPNL